MPLKSWADRGVLTESDVQYKYTKEERYVINGKFGCVCVCVVCV